MKRTIYRLTKARFKETALDGIGAIRFPGRWHAAGTPIVYASDSPACALLEVLVHREATSLLDHDNVLIFLRFDPDRHLLALPETVLPDDWQSLNLPTSTQVIGTRWFEEQDSVILEVPSAIIPFHHNYLINPRHPDFPELDIKDPEIFRIDPRLAS